MFRASLLVVLLLPSISFAWGFDGHRRLASLMQDALPTNHCLRTWFSSRQTTTLQDHACDPDRWRGTDSAEWPRHFLEVDWVNPPSNYPREFPAVVQLLGDRNATNNGTVPWRVEAKYAELVTAFRAKNQAAILDVAFVLSHYVFDSFSVLHDTRNADPNNGLHARWESDMLNVSSNINGITTLAATYYGTPGRADPRYNTFDVVIAGNALVNQLVQADVAANGSIAALYASTKDLTARRWGDGVTVMSSILWTAWAEAGSPELTGFSTGCSRSAPVAEIVLRGYPPEGGFKHAPPDAGVPDAGTEPADAGSGAGGGSGSGGGGGGFIGFGGGTGGGDVVEEPVGCGCSSGSFEGVALVVLGVWLARARR